MKMEHELPVCYSQLIDQHYKMSKTLFCLLNVNFLRRPKKIHILSTYQKDSFSIFYLLVLLNSFKKSKKRALIS